MNVISVCPGSPFSRETVFSFVSEDDGEITVVGISLSFEDTRFGDVYVFRTDLYQLTMTVRGGGFS